MPQAHPPARTRAPRCRRVGIILSSVTALVMTFLVTDTVVLAGAAQAASANPTGSLDSVTLSGSGVIAVTGWTADDDAPTTPLHVVLTDNGSPLTSMLANLARPDVAAARPGYGPAHGFSFGLFRSDGPHQLCVIASNTGAGSNSTLGCSTVTVHNNPTGTVAPVQLVANTVTVTGTATDSNSTSPVLVGGYVDGVRRQYLPASGPGNSFVLTLPVSEGSHQVCVSATNLGAGSDTQLGCQTVVVHNNPLGVLESAGQVPTGLRAIGYAIDLNTTAPVTVTAYLDGKLAGQTSAALARPDLTTRYPSSGPNHGFQFLLPAASGRHSLCLTALNIGPGANTSLGCSTVLIQNDPVGVLQTAQQVPSGVALSGWAIDQNSTAALTVKLSIDGRGAGSVLAGTPRPDLTARYPYVGPNHGYALVLQVPAGRHTVCVDAVNLGPGVNARLGCSVVTVQNNPLGTMDPVHQVPGGLRVTGWALDLNSVSPIFVSIYSDGRPVSLLTASTARAGLGPKYPTVGINHGFSVLAPIGPGRHTVCAYARNVGAGVNSTLGCTQVNLADRPLGSLDGAQTYPGALKLTGWTMDAFGTGPLAVRVYVDSRIAVITTAATPVPSLLAYYPNMGANHGFTIYAPLTPGTHQVCMYAINPRHATNLTLGCRTVTRTVNPTGYASSIARVGLTDSIAVSGWALDPDQTGPIQLQVTSDGVLKQTITANRGDLASTGGWPLYGYSHGFASTVPLDAGEHQVCVIARNAGLGGDVALGCTRITTSGLAAPAMPVAVTTWAGSHSVTLGWTAPRSDHAAITEYLVMIVGRGTMVVSGSATGAVVGSLTNGVRYTFSVRAVNSLGTGSAAAATAVPTNIPPQITPAPVSTSHYLRNLTGNLASDAALMRAMGAADASHDPSGHSYLVLLQIGGQDEINHGALLSATSRFVSYPGVVSAVKAYLDGYATQQRPYAPLTLAIGTNNDVDVSASAGVSWARNVVAPVVAYAAGHHPGIAVAGANDMEPGFSATVAQTRSWLTGYLAATGAKFVFNGSADGCSTGAAGSRCNNGWTMADLQWLSGGAAPTRTISLPQIYNYAMPLQWKYISLTGVSAGRARIYFGGPLTERTACSQAGSCGSISNADAWNKLWSAISSSAATRQLQMPHGTDLRIN